MSVSCRRYDSTTTKSSPPNSSASTAATPEDISNIVEKLESDPELLRMVMDEMKPEARRKLIVAGGAMEWFGREKVAFEVSEADYDKDRVISPKDFDRWFDSALKRHQAKKGDTPAAAAPGLPVPFFALVLIAVEAGLPFVGFGFLDNATMILAGDAIDRTLGMYLHCSVMASAAMGNVVSGCMGMQVHGFIEKLVMRFNLPVPPLSEDQRRSQRVFLAGHLGGTLGIFIGLSLGMMPLLFISHDEEKAEQKIFDSLDKNHDGTVTISEIMKALTNVVGVDHVDQTVVEGVVKFYSGGASNLTFEQFQAIYKDLKDPKKDSSTTANKEANKA